MALRNNNFDINIDARSKKTNNSFIIEAFKKIVVFKIRIASWIFGRVIK